jgi:hypothetical protein
MSLFFSLVVTVQMQVHLDAPQTDLKDWGCWRRAGSIPGERNSLNALICLMFKRNLRSAMMLFCPVFRPFVAFVFGSPKESQPE